MKVTWASFGLISGVLACEICSTSVNAQVIPDGTLKTTVLENGNNFTITEGNRVGNNLFHSFSQFSIPSKGSAFFNNASDIQNIFSRVTGGNVSNIDGLIQANGSANLFLLNPAGIMFGPNASLNIGGSFVGTTAESIKFADGVKFSASDTTTPPLLTMSVPVGLQLGANAGAIKVQGTPAPNFFFRPWQSFQAKAVALVGSEIDINAATLSLRDVQLELWALRNGEVGLNNQTGLQLTSPVVADWGNVSLRQSSLIDTTGLNGGAVNIRGRGLTLQEGSGISSATGSFGKGGGITVKTTEFVDLLGVSEATHYTTPGLFTSVFGDGGRAGDVTMETKDLRLANGAWLQSIMTFGFDFLTGQPIIGNNSRTGNINIKASNVEVRGYNPFPDFIGTIQPSAITTLIQVGENNESGKISIDADRISLLEGGRISADVLSNASGKSGEIAIKASESLEISGVTSGGITSAVISSIQPLARGQGGNISINTGHLTLSDGGTISSALAGSGEAGNIKIQAKNVEVSDPVIDSLSGTVSGITVAVGKDGVGQGGNIQMTADNLRVFDGGLIVSGSFGQGNAGNINLDIQNIDVQGTSKNSVNGSQLPSAIAASSTTNFNAGTVNITSDTVKVRDSAEVTVSNTGTGDAGNLNITANNIYLDNKASLRSEVKGGSQGNINLQANDVLLLRRGSNITTNATGTSTGGNIDITAGVVVALPDEDSDIVANAVRGSGGNIQINTQGILGLKFRPQTTEKSDITASSQFGVSGTVQINNIGVDPNSGLVELPSNVTDPSQQIASGCSANQGSSFVATGRGGIPQNPSQDVRSDTSAGLYSLRTWSDTRDISTYRKTQPIQAEIPQLPETLVQATGWYRNVQGKIELVADKSSNQVQQLTCAAIPQN
ncbi:beta strand repeat-containing protein [Calothrix sp. PCC 6303]|uniref:beta strand repeat-containing protein n=1 Tax=Calothrix sp. PCC 6303 TaxID=1170562 RepID=UPI0002A04310|nr:S-layer family protein [Calothrix sp. PCC 6303]AFZ02485.1 filamentous hemagglutinin family outer membrane protein [Calothrix sp. PCC 6303]